MTKPGDRDEPADFEALVRPHVDHLYRVAYRFTGRREDAEDLVQDLLAKLYPRCGEMAQVELLRPWLTRVLYRQFVDQYRKRARMRLLGSGGEDDPGDPFDRMASDNPGPEEETASSLAQNRLQVALDQLNRDQRAVVALHDMEGYTLEEVSGMLEVPTGTLKSRLHRARARLREILEGQGTL